MIRSLTALTVLFGASLGGADAADPLAGKRPNIVFVLTDDQGYGDVTAHGNPILKTPNLDRLHAEGVRFTDFHVSPTCSPTRSALLTGQYPARLHVTDWIAGHKRPFAKLKVPDWTMQLPLETHSLAEAFKAAGYTTASIGK